MRWWHLRQLRSPDPQTRARAASKLARPGDAAVVEPLLAAALVDPWDGVREAAARSLAAVQLPGTAERLVATAMLAPIPPDRIHEVISATASALAAIGTREGAFAVVAALVADDPAVRQRAGWLWDKLSFAVAVHASAAVESVAAVLRADPCADRRRAAAEALARIKDRGARPALLEALADPASSVRSAAVASGLFEPGDAERVAALLRDPSIEVRDAAARARVLRSRADVLATALPLETDPGARLAIVEVLGGCEGPDATAALARGARPASRARALLERRGWSPSSPAERACWIVHARTVPLPDELLAAGGGSADAREARRPPRARGARGSGARDGLPGPAGGRGRARHDRRAGRDRAARAGYGARPGRGRRRDRQEGRGRDPGARGAPRAPERLRRRAGAREPGLGSERRLRARAAHGRRGEVPRGGGPRSTRGAPARVGDPRPGGKGGHTQVEGQTGIAMAHARQEYLPASCLQHLLERDGRDVPADVLREIAALEGFTFSFTAVGNCDYAETIHQAVEVAPIRQLARQELVQRGLPA